MWQAISPINKLPIGKVIGLLGKRQDQAHETNTELVRGSWKDEAWTLVFALLFLAPLHPNGVEMTERVFNAFQLWPDDFKYLFMFIVSASFGAGMTGKGIRGMHNMKVRKKEAGGARPQFETNQARGGDR